jgi:membrane protease subunit (stomatin/prohibitin family)
MNESTDAFAAESEAASSAKMKERLQEEFSQSGIEVEGLKIGIENLEEVIETKGAIESR